MDTDKHRYNGFEMKHYTWDSVPLEVMSDVISRKVISGQKGHGGAGFPQEGRRGAGAPP